MTFREFARDCYHQLGSWGYSDQTQHRYDRTWMQFLAFLKGRGLNDDVRSFNDRNVFEFAEWLGRSKAHPNTIINMLSALSTLARYGMMRRDDHDRRFISEDPTKSFRWPVSQRVETKWAHPDEIRKMVDLDVPTYKAIPRDIFIETGIRVGEACRLNVENFKELDGRFVLSIKRKGRGQQRRVETSDIPISRGLAESLRNWLLARQGSLEPDSPLFVNSEGQRWKRAVLGNMIARLADAAGVTRLRVSPHKLRHSKNVRDRIAGIDSATRARLNGHSSLRSQERYDHIFADELTTAADHSLDELQKWIGKPFRAEAENEVADRNEQQADAQQRREVTDS